MGVLIIRQLEVFMISRDVCLVFRCLEYGQVCREMLTELESAKQA